MVDFSKFPRGVPKRDPRKSTSPAAQWADPRVIGTAEHWRYAPGKIFLGSLDNNLIGMNDDRHLMTIAGSRAGKGVSTIIPNLLEYPGSVIVIDPKGENAKHTASRRGKGSAHVKRGLNQAVHVLDPYGVSGHATAHFNPLDAIDIKSRTVIDDAALVAESLVILEEGNGRHFSLGARNLLRGLILQVCSKEPPNKRNLVSVREMLHRAGAEYDDLMRSMKENDACGGVIRMTAVSLQAKEDRELSGIFSTAIEQTEFLDSPPIGECVSSSDFKLRNLKLEPTTIYLCLPAMRMATQGRWLRLVINQALAAMESEPKVPQHPVLFLMDEFAVLDHLPSVEKAAGLIAGAGVRLWPILQDLNQLKAIYKERWETFLGNAGLLQFFGNYDLFTLEHIAQRLGKTTIIHMQKGEVNTSQHAGGFTGETEQLHTIELMTGDEVARFFSRITQAQILLWPGSDPIAIDRVRYYDHPHFAGKFDP